MKDYADMTTAQLTAALTAERYAASEYAARAVAAEIALGALLSSTPQGARLMSDYAAAIQSRTIHERRVSALVRYAQEAAETERAEARARG